MIGLSVPVELEPVECPQCGMVFALTKVYFDARVADQGFFWCPDAHNIQLGVPGPLEVLETRRVQLADEVVGLERAVSALRQEFIERTLAAPAAGGR